MKPYGAGFLLNGEDQTPDGAGSARSVPQLIERYPRNAERIYPYLGGDEINTDPRHSHRRWIIDFDDFPLRRQKLSKTWADMDDQQRAECRHNGIMPLDYPLSTAADWPDLLAIVEELVKPERLSQKALGLRQRWWLYERNRPGLRKAVRGHSHVLALSQVSQHLAVVRLSTGSLFDQRLIICPEAQNVRFGVMQSRVHELWARSFAATLEDRLCYTPSDCFNTYPFPKRSAEIERIGTEYADHRARLMVARNEGLTKIYNRFHRSDEHSPDIQQLRALHQAMDDAVLRAYGWDDLAENSTSEFLTEDTEQEHCYQGRLFWPAPFRDEVLARLLALNAERAADEAARGLAPAQTSIGADELEEA